MRIQDFPRPKNDTARGIHWSASVYHPSGATLDFWLNELQAMKISWVKVLDDGGGSSLALCQRLLGAGMMPIVRIYRPEPNPGSIGGREEDTIRRLIGAGVRYFETNNEPDLPVEWHNGNKPADWLHVAANNFILDADKIIAAGGLPGFPALAVGNRFNPIAPVVARGRADLFEKGAWIAVHSYTLNHPLDYPYDAVNQVGAAVAPSEYDRLGGWAWDNASRAQINAWRMTDKNAGDTLEDDPSCFLSFYLIDQMATKLLGHAVPVISTEGGPVVGSRDDRRYPRLTPSLHAEMCVAITEFMQGTREIHGMRRPESFFATCHWLVANYRIGSMNSGWESQAWYSDFWNSQFNLRGELPIVAALKNLPVQSQDAPANAVIAGKVVRADTDEPLAELTVHLLQAGKEIRVEQIAADGSFVFEKLAPGLYDVSIAQWGIVRKGVQAGPEPVQRIAIRLVGGNASLLTGIVQSPQGGAAEGVRVMLARESDAVSETTTGKDGVFRFERLPLGSYRLSIPDLTISGIALDGWQTKGLKLTLAATSSMRYSVVQKRLLSAEETGNHRLIYGIVTNAAGQPLNGTKLELRWEGATASTRFPVTTTGKNPSKPAGYYEFLHSPGVFSVCVTQGDFPGEIASNLDTANVPGRSRQPITYEVNFRLQGSQASRGQIDGAVAGAQAGQKLVLTGPREAEKRETVADASGAFGFPSLSPGQYRLMLPGIGAISDEIALQPGALWKVFFPLKSTLSGRVVDSPPGTTAVLHAPAALGWTRQAPVASNGSFTFSNLPPGRYRLEVGGQEASDLVLTGENQLQLAPIDLSSGRRGVIRGHVTNGEGAPQKDAVVILRREQIAVAQMKTQADGTYRFSNLQSGTYAIEAVGLGVIGGAVMLDGESEQVVDIRWPAKIPLAVVQGRVLSASGQAQPGLRVRLLRDNTEIAQAQSDSTGAFRFANLPAGIYALSVGQGAATIATLRLEDGAAVTRDITLPGDTTKMLKHYLLLHPFEHVQADGATARLILDLTVHHLGPGVLAGFSAEEAAHASKVTLVGDAVPSETEARLKKAGCEVTRLAGDGYAVASAFEQMFAEG